MAAEWFGGGGIWIDFVDYAERLFAGGRGGLWTDPVQFLSVYSQGQRLLQSDVLSIPISSFFMGWLDAHPEAADSWRGKSATFVCKKLLGLEEPRRVVGDVLSGLESLFPGHPTALVTDSPRRWLSEARKRTGAGGAGEGAVEPEEDEIDAAAMYLADCLRGFSGYRIFALVLDEDATDPERVGGLWSLYQPVWNVADHYQWLKGVRWHGEAVALPVGREVDFALFPSVSWDGMTALWERGLAAAGGLNPDFWREPGPLPEAAARGPAYGIVPADAHPEHVLDHLRTLRESK